MYTALMVATALFGVFASLLAIQQIWMIPDTIARRWERLGPGYEVVNPQEGDLLYITGPRDMDPVLFGRTDPKRLVYQENGLVRGTREWAMRPVWTMLRVQASIFAISAGAAFVALWFSVPHLKSLW